MTIDAQRIRSRAARIREERATRPGENGAAGPTTKPYDASRDVDEGADLGPSPVSDTEDRIARVEGVSTFRSVDDMGGLGDPGRGAMDGYGAEITRLGSELAEQVDARVQDWLADARDEFGNVTQTKPQSFMLGALFGGLILALGVLLGGRSQNR